MNERSQALRSSSRMVSAQQIAPSATENAKAAKPVVKIKKIGLIGDVQGLASVFLILFPNVRTNCSATLILYSSTFKGAA